ncbi:hypothetical protein A4R26_13950 [Niastella populi]|uniref:Uncharacterized protein n=1 Tax=Niastella populi TaxID=550983 RepID=A0A1V9G6B9_9BACT|nr:hypothetical protein A4R26_13950 [Niastella populi]
MHSVKLQKGLHRARGIKASRQRVVKRGLKMQPLDGWLPRSLVAFLLKIIKRVIDIYVDFT